MMLQPPTLADVTCSTAMPADMLTLDDFADFTPSLRDELRLAIRAKRLSNGLSVDPSSDGGSSSSVSELPRASAPRATPEETDRKKRRRERNKIAAAKCRNKKKEKTETLQKESEKLESVNAELKAQIQELKQQKQQLVYMLNLHRPTCIVRAQNGQTPEDERNLLLHEGALLFQETLQNQDGGLHLQDSTLNLTDLTNSTSVTRLTLDSVQCPGHL